jgi:phosphate transport system substrate-binding protein
VKGFRTAAIAVLLVAAMALSACGTDDNTGSGADAGGGAAGAGGSAADPSGSAGSAGSSPDPSSEGSANGGTPGSGATASAISFESAGFACATGTLRSSGSTAQGNAIAQWIADYNAKCGATINDYGGGGSGKGVSDFIAKQTDFGGSDSAMKQDELAEAQTDRCDGNEAIDLPLVTGPIAIAYHLSGVDKLIMTPTVLTGIFGGDIKTWNDPAIAAINPGVSLPSQAIQTVHRSEDSGTTDNFTKYLAAAGGWTFTGGKAWTAPGGTGAQGSDGVAKAVQSTEGAIGYVEWSYALNNDLAIAEVDNGSGPVALTAESAGLAVQAADIVGEGKDLALKLDYATKAPGAYPVVLVTYELVCSAGNGDTAELLKSFLGYAATDGQASLVGLGSAPLPAPVQQKVVAAIQTLS